MRLQLTIPTKNAISARTVLSLWTATHQLKSQLSIELRIMQGKSNIDQARSILATEWWRKANARTQASLKEGKTPEVELFLFIDSDQTFTAKDIIDLINLNSDVACCTYSRANGTSIGYFKDTFAFLRGENNEMMYSGTGFMMIRLPILNKIFKFLQEEFKDKGGCEMWVGSNDNERNVVPFFKQRFIESELNPDPTHRREWTSEDYAFCWLTRHSGGTVRGMFSPTLGHEVHRLLHLNEPKRPEIWEKGSIVYVAGSSVEPWGPQSIQTGIGGSETAVIYLTQYWAKMGRKVVVYGSAQGTAKGVEWRPMKDFRAADRFDTLILWRGMNMKFLDMKISARNLIVDLHDCTSPKAFTKTRIGKNVRVFTKSDWQRKLYPNFPDSNFEVIPNGVEASVVDKVTAAITIKSAVPKLVYSSAYDRGLEYMLRWGWPIIKKQVPDAEFHIFYGWDTYVKFKGENTPFQQMMNQLMLQDGVFHHGRISQEKLLIEKASAHIHYYVGDYTEIDCISVRESAMVDCLPVTSSVGAMGEKDYTVQIPGNPTTKEMQVTAATKIVELLRSRTGSLLAPYTEGTTRLRREETWERVAARWLEKLEDVSN